MLCRGRPNKSLQRLPAGRQGWLIAVAGFGRYVLEKTIIL